MGGNGRRIPSCS
jgi:hypothetical protein